MHRYSFSHLSNGELIRELRNAVAQDRTTTVALLAHIAEFDRRRLYLRDGYPSMFAFCVGELHLSEGATWSRIRAARAGRRFPVLFEALADGRLHLAAMVLLAPRLRPDNVTELVVSATHRTKRQVEKLLAERFPMPAPPERCDAQLIPGSVESFQQLAAASVSTETSGPAIEAQPAAPAFVPPAAAPARVTPVGPRVYTIEAELDEEAHRNLCRAQELLGRPAVTIGLGEAIGRALKLLVAVLEKKRFAATDNPRTGTPSRNPRHIPARVKRAVAKRDQDRCAFVGDNGKRCEARHGLEFDHILPVARGGESTVANVRLLCRAHNQFVAERAFGHAFMNGMRLAAAEARTATGPAAPRT